MDNDLTKNSGMASVRFEGGDSLARIERTVSNLTALARKVRHRLVNKPYPFITLVNNLDKQYKVEQ